MRVVERTQFRPVPPPVFAGGVLGPARAARPGSALLAGGCLPVAKSPLRPSPRLLVQLDHLRLADHSHKGSDPLGQLRSDVVVVDSGSAHHSDSHPARVSTAKSSCGARPRQSELDSRDLVSVS